VLNGVVQEDPDLTFRRAASPAKNTCCARQHLIREETFNLKEWSARYAMRLDRAANCAVVTSFAPGV
jgi:hypothetical protein